MLAFPGWLLHHIAGLQMWEFGICMCLHFCLCLRKQSLKDCRSNPPAGRLSSPAFEEELVMCPPLFLPKCSAGPQDALAHKASIQGCHLTDSKKVAGRWTAVCRWTRKKQRAEQIQSEYSKRKLLNHRPFQP